VDRDVTATDEVVGFIDEEKMVLVDVTTGPANGTR